MRSSYIPRVGICSKVILSFRSLVCAQKQTSDANPVFLPRAVIEIKSSYLAGGRLNCIEQRPHRTIMESKRTTRASSQDVATRRTTRKSPGRRKSPSPIVEEASPVSQQTKPRGRPKSASRKEEKAPTKAPKSPAKKAVAKSESKVETTPPKKSPRGRPPKAAAETSTTTASTISSTSTTKTVTLSSAASDLKSRLRASMTPLTRSVSRSMSRSVYDREFSDDELDTNDDRPGSVSFDRRSASRQPQDRLTRYGVIGSVALLLTMVAVVLGVTIACTSTGCNPKWAALQKTLAQCSTWYDRQATAIGVLFIAAVTLVSALPTGRVVNIPLDEDESKTYTFNGFATFVLALGVALYSTDGLQFIYRHYLHLCVVSVLTALVVSGAAFIRSRFQPAEAQNSFARTQRPVFDFIVGREVSPMWFNRIDAKLAFYRVSIITTLLLNIVFLTKTIVLPTSDVQLNAESIIAFVTGIRADVATTAAASMVVLYCLDLLIFEHHLTSSFDLQCEGFGALVLLRYALFPFVVSVVPKYVLENATPAPWWVIVGMAVLFTIGLLMKRVADQLKYSFRMYPLEPKFDSKFKQGKTFLKSAFN